LFEQEGIMATEKEIQELKRRHSLRLLNQPGVCGVGVEKDEAGGYVLAMHLDTDDPQILSQLPKEIEGHPIKFLRSGPFRKFARPEE
jgi:hypothetical protein